MASIFKNQILKHLSRFAKNLSANMIQLSALKGYGELNNLELNELVLTEVLELPSWLRITYAYCNHITIKIHWTKLKTHPIHLTLDELIVETETCEELRLISDSPNASIYSGSQGRYGFADRVIDGMLIHIGSVNINFTSPAFEASLMLSRLTVESRTPSWKQGELRLCRIKDAERGEILLFKQIDWQVVRIEAKAKSTSSENAPQLTPLRLITNQACCRLTIKKRLKDCSLVDWKVMVVLDDLLWVLTDSQLLAAIHFSSTLGDLIRRATDQAHKVKAKHKLEQQQNEARQQMKQQQQQQKQGTTATANSNLSTISKFFNHYNVHETSYHILCHRIDLHLCDELNPKEGRSGYEGLQKGGAFLLSLRKFEVDYYPYHQAFSSREHWVRYFEPSSGRSAWVNQLISFFQDHSLSANHRKVTVHRAPPHKGESMTEESDTPTMRRSSLLQKRSLMSSCIVIRLDEYQLFKVSTAATARRKQEKFLASDRHSISLPPETKALHLELTSYYYPGDISASAPPPNLYAHLGPLLLTYDISTILWLNTFFLNLENSLMQLLAKVPQDSSTPKPLLIKVEALMLQVEYHAEANEPSHPERPKAMKFQSSRVVATNCRVGDHASRLHLSHCLESLSQSELIYQTSSYPWKVGDFVPIPEVFVSHAMDAENNIFGGGIWSIHFDPLWLEFIGCEPGRSRPQTFIEPLPLTLWFTSLFPDGPTAEEHKLPDYALLAHFHSGVNVQISHHQYLFLMRFLDSYTILSAYITLDTQAILKDCQTKTFGFTTWLPQVDVSIILRSLNQLSATSDSMEPLSLQDSSNEDDLKSRAFVLKNNDTTPQGNESSPPPSESSFCSPLLSPTPISCAEQAPVLPPTPADSIHKGLQSATSAMKKGLYHFMPSMESILPPTSDSGMMTDDDTTSLRSDFSSDSDQFVMLGVDSASLAGDDDFFHCTSSVNDVEIASEVKEDTFSNATTNLSERKRELISILMISLRAVELVAQTHTDGSAILLLQCHHLSTAEQPSVSWENFQNSFASSSRSRNRQQPPPGGTSGGPCCLKMRIYMPPIESAAFPPPPSHINVFCQDLPLTLLKSSLAALSDFMEDDVVYPINPLNVTIRDLTLTIVEEKSVLNPVPVKLVLPSCLLERSEDGTIKFVPIPPQGEEKCPSPETCCQHRNSTHNTPHVNKRSLEELAQENERLHQELRMLHRLRSMTSGNTELAAQLAVAQSDIQQLREERHSLLAALQERDQSNT